ncbi:MAG: universal stress protein [Thermoplasmata archaeon]
MPIERILIATDGSECSKKAVIAGLELAKQLHAIPIILYVVNESSIPAMPPDAMLSDVYSFLYSLGEEILEKISIDAKKFGLDIKKKIEAGIPSDKIIDVAEKEDCKLIVLGTHGRSGLRKLILGSTAERVIRHSKVPVMVVRGHD